jgi:ribonucleoside-diphosphate reductase alpha chain
MDSAAAFVLPLPLIAVPGKVVEKEEEILLEEFNPYITKYNDVTIDYSRDNLLTTFGKAVLADRYCLPEEKSPQELFARVASAFADDIHHAQRIYDYLSLQWFMAATPVLSNGGTDRGMPISCFLNEIGDSRESISATNSENMELAARGGGIGSYWGNLRSCGEKVGKVGQSSGIIPFMKIMDAQTLAISQGNLRRGSAAAYLPIWHPEIEEFLEVRRPTGGDSNRKCLNLHHGVLIDDKFMEAVRDNQPYALLSPKNNSVIKAVSARDLWIRLLTSRLETGEPYIVFIDNVNKAIPLHHKIANRKVKTSNLCSEITLYTDQDRTAVCCLSSLNLAKFGEWEKEEEFIPDIMRFLDNVLQHFIENAPEVMSKATYSAMRERSIGLGVMGFQTFLQQKGIPFESAMAKSLNFRIFKHIQKEVNQVSKDLAEERGPCPDAAEVNIRERFTNKTAIAPTASISIICGNVSPCIEPFPGNAFNQKTLSGNFLVKNQELEKVLEKHGKNDKKTWSSITTNEGSVQHLTFLSDLEKDVFKTAFEIDQRWIIELAADRTPYIDQAQSVNIFLTADVHKRYLHLIHFKAWEDGMKSLYYCRSMSLQRAHKVSHLVERKKLEEEVGFEECLACQ